MISELRQCAAWAATSHPDGLAPHHSLLASNDEAAQRLRVSPGDGDSGLAVPTERHRGRPPDGGRPLVRRWNGPGAGPRPERSEGRGAPGSFYLTVTVAP